MVKDGSSECSQEIISGGSVANFKFVGISSGKRRVSIWISWSSSMCQYLDKMSAIILCVILMCWE